MRGCWSVRRGLIGGSFVDRGRLRRWREKGGRIRRRGGWIGRGRGVWVSRGGL